MSEQIDWSKAPEGAMVLLKHVRDDSYAWAVSHSEDARAWHKWNIKCSFYLMASMWTVVAERPATPSWSGEGLPPVGVACKIIGGDSKWWSYSGFERGDIVTVRHSFKNSKGYDMVVVEGCDGGCLAVTVDCVEVIRTHEQIAADEREAAIKEIASVINIANCMDCGTHTATALYDAGYRKP